MLFTRQTRAGRAGGGGLHRPGRLDIKAAQPRIQDFSARLKILKGDE